MLTFPQNNIHYAYFHKDRDGRGDNDSGGQRRQA